MKILSEGERSGYSIMKRIGEITGCGKPSAGSIYPLLDGLLNESLVSVKAAGRKKIYSLTKGGKEKLSALMEHRDSMFDKIVEGCNIFESLFEKKDIAFVSELFEKIKKGETPFKEIVPEIIELRIAIYQIIKKDKTGKNQEKIKKILRGAIEGLKKLK